MSQPDPFASLMEIDSGLLLKLRVSVRGGEGCSSSCLFTKIFPLSATFMGARATSMMDAVSLKVTSHRTLATVPFNQKTLLLRRVRAVVWVLDFNGSGREGHLWWGSVEARLHGTW